MPRPTHTRSLRSGFTLFETVIALGIVAFVFTMITRQLVETSRLSLNVTRTLEHSRNAREFLDTLAADIRSAQVVVIHPDFTTRDTVQRDGQAGNYLVLHRFNPSGTITRTVGYYVVNLGSNGWAVYRHDSATGDSSTGVLPASSSQGTHRLIKRAVRLSSSNNLFTSTRDRAVSVEGEFGTHDTFSSKRTEYIRCTLSSRS